MLDNLDKTKYQEMLNLKISHIMSNSGQSTNCSQWGNHGVEPNYKNPLAKVEVYIV